MEMRKAGLAWSWKLRNFSAASEEEQRAMRGWPPISRHRSFRTELVQSNCLRRFRASEEPEPPASMPCFLALTRKRTRTGVFLWFSIPRPPWNPTRCNERRRRRGRRWSGSKARVRVRGEPWTEKGRRKSVALSHPFWTEATRWIIYIIDQIWLQVSNFESECQFKS